MVGKEGKGDLEEQGALELKSCLELSLVGGEINQILNKNPGKNSCNNKKAQNLL